MTKEKGIFESLWGILENNQLYKKLITYRFFSRLLNRETITYIFFGFVTTVLGFACFAGVLWIFEHFGILGEESPRLTELLKEHKWLGFVPDFSSSLRVLVANIAAAVPAVLFSFVANKIFVFKSKSRNLQLVTREFIGFIASRLFSVFAETIILVVVVGFFQTRELYAKVLSTVVVVVLNYFMSKLLFSTRKEKPADS